ncbi:hypothetical protein GCM10010430_69590 [Kitasatospora cystarginea]|uniref:Uncharacterized protein n=1 Tax=Kitasatospora cystarginea TaxID=58350 RepID=A0ABP5RWF5_9ACTN
MSDVTVSVEAVEEVRSVELAADLLDGHLKDSQIAVTRGDWSRSRTLGAAGDHFGVARDERQ